MTRQTEILSRLMLLAILMLSATSELNGQSTESVRGTVIDAKTGEPVSYAYLHLESINRTATTDRDGRFQIQNVPEGSYRVLIHRIGYNSRYHEIQVTEGETSDLELDISSTNLTGEAVQVIGESERTVGSNLEHASRKVTGEELRRDLGSTLSATLESQPGFSERSMGVAPGRPVMRGLGDERVLILEDGQQTGDVSWASGDHAVTVDPNTADEIEIARGPAALEYGAGAIGGIINVVRNQIPTTIPGRSTGIVSAQGVSVNQGGMGGASLTTPLGENSALNVDLNGRFGGDVQTPNRKITNSYLQSTNNGFGGSYVRPWGYAGLSGNIYYSEYGIPPDPEQGHPEGVDIEMMKTQTEGRAEVLLPHSSFNTLEIRSTYVHYEHAEIESNGTLGTRYEMATLGGSVKARNSEWGPFSQGVIGISSEWIDYSVFGSRTPNSGSLSGALFMIQEADRGPLHLEAGARLNHAITRPDQNRSSYIGEVRQRNFTGLESSLSASYDLGKGVRLGSTLIHSWRAPSLEELYSEGPHLAAYAFETGNPDLEAERGLGTELFLRYSGQRANLELAGYHNQFANYIHSQDTGRPSVPRADLREFQFVGTEATIYGFELSGEYNLTRTLSGYGHISVTIGNRHVDEQERQRTGLEDTSQPLPLMPPAKGRIGVRWSNSGLTVDGRGRFAARQDRLPECPESSDPDLLYPCETPTDGYLLFDLNIQYRFDWGSTLHTVSLNGLNLTDRSYYNHLSLIKDIFPEPGRSVNLLYRVYF
ncbi:MAG: TonB-dependent receptor [Balneolaceae bacterium]